MYPIRPKSVQFHSCKLPHFPSAVEENCTIGAYPVFVVNRTSPQLEPQPEFWFSTPLQESVLSAKAHRDHKVARALRLIAPVALAARSTSGYAFL